MKKWKLLPKMALKGIVSNGMVYYPYMIAAVFSVFTYFVFCVILHNDLASILPYRAYAWIILEMGKFLLSVILFIFLYYAGSFIIKRRKAEIGLYSLLGLEKKHIAIMLFWETLILYGVTMTGGIVSGIVLSKMLFLILLRMSGISLHLEFVFEAGAFGETFGYFGVVFLSYFVCQMWEIGKSRPTQLMSGARRGEKEPRFLGVWSAAGIVVLAVGYYNAVNAKADSMIFINFFLAVFLVVIGTYFIFTSASVWFLKKMRRNKKIYYRAKNFITISGMYYRMKKNAAGLVNICIFSTMMLITLTCTVSLYLGLDGVINDMAPYDMEMEFEEENGVTPEALTKEVVGLEEAHGVKAQRIDLFDSISLSCSVEGNAVEMKKEDAYDERNYGVVIMTLQEYENLTGDSVEMAENEVIIHTQGEDFGFETLRFMGIESHVKKEVEGLYPYPKAQENKTGKYVIIVRDKKTRDEYVRTWAQQNGVEDMESFLKAEE
ncbi:MAG: hypothetical protein NC231_14395 [Bacillus sp. (in: Bacteria)]|nr:hypothetical protein [Bacillus sp. (in: firmicutes)]MCM1426918.1 hypothetical protein [Eubacterium sp.]